MWANYLLTFYRTLARHRLYTALNVIGLALGLTVFLVLWIAVRYESTYDRTIPDAANIYRLDALHTRPGAPREESATTPGVMAPLLAARFPQIKAQTRLLSDKLVFKTGPRLNFESMIWADPQVFAVLDLPFAAGDPRTALADTSGLVVSERLANKALGGPAALGKTITIVTEAGPRAYRVTGVLRDLPANSHLRFDAVARLDRSAFSPETSAHLFEEWGSSMPSTYVRLAAGADPKRLEADFPSFIDARASGLGDRPSQYFGLRLARLTDLHFDDLEVRNAFKPGADRLLLAALTAIGAAALCIAGFNYVNLATARAALRAREVAIRKVVGGSRADLVAQFMLESLLTVLLAALVALVLVELSLPSVGALLGSDLSLRYFGPDGVTPILGLVVVGLTLGAGAYPAMALSRFRPAAVLASSRSPGGGRLGSLLRQGVIVAQFAVSAVLIVSALVVVGQSQFLRTADLGFKRESLLLVSGLKDANIAPTAAALLAELRVTPGVVAVSTSNRAPGGEDQTAMDVGRPGLKGQDPTLVIEKVGQDYFRLYGAQMIAGRDFKRDNRLDDQAGLQGAALFDRGLNVIINRQAASAMGFSEPVAAVGQTLTLGHGRYRLTVVGVVNSLRFLSPREQTPPIMYIQNTIEDPTSPSASTATLRVAAGSETRVLEAARAVWRRHAPQTPFQGETVASALDPFYAPSERLSRLFAVGAALAVAIACVGLYGVAAFNAARRAREIGIRKALGASTPDILKLMLLDALRPVIIGAVLACPLAYLLMQRWLAGFDQRITLGAGQFAVAILLSATAALATVLLHTVSLARVEPSRTLREE